MEAAIVSGGRLGGRESQARLNSTCWRRPYKDYADREFRIFF